MINNLTNLSEQEQRELITIKAASEGFPEYCVAIDPRYSLEWFHQQIALRLEKAVEQVENGEDVRLMIFMPPRHGKSDSATQKFPSWVLGNHPEWPFIVASYSQELATDFGQGTRDLMERTNYKAIFDTRLREDTTAKAKWMTDEGGGYTAVGVGGAITGRGFKIGIVDDPFKNREEADSPVTRESVHKWWRSTFYTRQEGNTCMILILTRWHDDDLAGRLLKEEVEARTNGETDYDKWEVLEFKAIAEEDESVRLKGEALWPEKFNVSKLMKTKSALGSYEFSALYQQNPIDEESQEFKKDWIQYRTMDEVEKMVTRKFATIDPAGSKKKKSDNTGVTRNWVNDLNEWHLKSRRYRINSKGIIDLIFELHAEGFEVIGIEEGVFTDAIEPFLKIRMEETGIYPNVIPLKHGGTMKETRIRGLIPRYENRKVFHIEGFCSDLEDEYLRFPKSAYDDCLDTTAYQNQVAESPSAGYGDRISEREIKVLNETNNFRGNHIIGMTTSLPMQYMVGNQWGISDFKYNDPTHPFKEIEVLLKGSERFFLFTDQVGEVLGLKALQEKYPSQVFICSLVVNHKTQQFIKWGTKSKFREVELNKNPILQQVIDEMKDERLVVYGTKEKWQRYIDEFLTLYRVWEEEVSGTKVASWESNAPIPLVKSTIYFRAGIEHFGETDSYFVGEQSQIDKGIPEAPYRDADGNMPAPKLTMPLVAEQDSDWRYN